MSYGLFFLLAAAIVTSLAMVQTTFPLWLFLWPLVSLIALSWAYLRNDSRAFGKQGNGRLAPLRALLFGPWLAFAAIVEFFARHLDRTPSFATVGDVTYGRRTNISPVGAGTTIIDLTAEFSEPPALRTSGYVAFPILDARAPTSLAAIDELIAATGAGPVFIHCAQGRGRTGLVAACFLLARGAAASPEAALEMLQKNRPGISLNREQTAFLSSFAQRPK